MSQSRYERLLRDGAPVIQKENGGYEINVAAFVNFMIADAVDKVTKGEDGGLSWDQAKRRDKIIQANIRELDLLERQNVLVEVDAFRPWLREKLGIIRSRMLVIRSQVRVSVRNKPDSWKMPSTMPWPNASKVIWCCAAIETANRNGNRWRSLPPTAYIHKSA